MTARRKDRDLVKLNERWGSRGLKRRKTLKLSLRSGTNRVQNTCAGRPEYFKSPSRSGTKRTPVRKVESSYVTKLHNPDKLKLKYCNTSRIGQAVVRMAPGPGTFEKCRPCGPTVRGNGEPLAAKNSLGIPAVGVSGSGCGDSCFSEKPEGLKKKKMSPVEHTE